MSVDLLDRDEVADRTQHAADLGAVVVDGDVAAPLDAQGAQRGALVLLATDAGPGLGDLQPCHQEATSARAFSSAAGATCSTGSPRRGGTASGVSGLFSAGTVACTTLIAFAEPSDLLSTSWMPAHSSTARAEPPAITPRPGAAGRSSDTPADI